MKIGFAGTPAFSRTALEALLAHDVDHVTKHRHEVTVVLTQPDRAAGRGMQVTASPVKACAQAHDIPVLQPRGLRLDSRWAEDAEAAKTALEALDLDVLVVAAYGLILPEWVLKLPRHGCLNIHASLLPRWRGAAPIQRAIQAGDTATGITIMQMDAGLDTGDMLLKETVPISEEDTAETLHDRLAAVGGALIVQAIDQLETGSLTATPQDSTQATYAEKLQKSEAALDLNLPAAQLARQVRAFNPFPGTTIMLPGKKGLSTEPVKVWQAQALPPGETGTGAVTTTPSTPPSTPPGTLLACEPTGIDVATGEGVLRLLVLQRPGGKRQTVDIFLQGQAFLKDQALKPG